MKKLELRKLIKEEMTKTKGTYYSIYEWQGSNGWLLIDSVFDVRIALMKAKKYLGAKRDIKIIRTSDDDSKRTSYENKTH